jgi:hypothetical protein
VGTVSDDELKVQVARLDERVDSLNDVVLNMRDNHLAHIAEDIKELRTNQTKILVYLSVITALINGGMQVIV